MEIILYLLIDYVVFADYMLSPWLLEFCQQANNMSWMPILHATDKS